MSKEPIVPTSEDDWKFAKKGFQERNLESLIGILSTKQATDTLTELAKTKPETWNDIKESVINLKEFVIGGGISTIKQGIKEQFELTIQDAFAPLINEFAPIISLIYEALEPFIDLLVPVAEWIVSWLKPIVQWLADTIKWIVEKILWMFNNMLTKQEFQQQFQDTVDDLIAEGNFDQQFTQWQPWQARMMYEQGYITAEQFLIYMGLMQGGATQESSTIPRIREYEPGY
jgi:hypothetical protein